MDELKECPWCLEKDIRFMEFACRDGSRTVGASCIGCGMIGPVHVSRESAVKGRGPLGAFTVSMA